MIRAVAILETMWDWRAMTSGAGYKAEAPRYFNINAQNFSGRRLYGFVGQDSRLLVTNACRELVSSSSQHGKPDSLWLGENLRILDGHIDLLLVCGKVAQATFDRCGYRPKEARTVRMPHPAGRLWTKAALLAAANVVQREVGDWTVSVSRESFSCLPDHPVQSLHLTPAETPETLPGREPGRGSGE